MIAGREVRPGRWSEVIDLFDNGKYSAVWGTYDKGAKKTLGVRWNGDDELPKGYPKSVGNPVWYIEPEFLQVTILLSLLNEVNKGSYAREEEYVKNINIAIAEFYANRHK